MEYGDMYLRFPDKASADELLADYEGSIDIIGEIEGTTGWHVNTRGQVTDELKAYDTAPATPIRVWA